MSLISAFAFHLPLLLQCQILPTPPKTNQILNTPSNINQILPTSSNTNQVLPTLSKTNLMSSPPITTYHPGFHSFKPHAYMKTGTDKTYTTHHILLSNISIHNLLSHFSEGPFSPHYQLNYNPPLHVAAVLCLCELSLIWQHFHDVETTFLSCFYNFPGDLFTAYKESPSFLFQFL